MLNIAHRGASGQEPANTLPAFSLAIKSDCDMIETDVHVCKSGEAVLSHDPRVSNGSSWKFIKSLRFDELQKIDAGNGNRVPSLEQLLDLDAGRTGINLELKSPGSARATADILKKRFVAGQYSPDDFLITSFDHYELEDFRILLPEVPRGVLLKSLILSVNDYLERLGTGTLVTSLEFVRKTLVDEIHQGGRKILVYTVNEESDVRALVELGVDGVITNYPGRIGKMIAQAGYR